MENLAKTNCEYVTYGAAGDKYALIKDVALNIANTASTDVLAASTAGKRYLVLGYRYVLSGNADETIQFKSGTTPTVLTGAMPNKGITTVERDYSPWGLMRTGLNEKLTVVLTGTTKDCRGYLTYAELDE